MRGRRGGRGKTPKHTQPHSNAMRGEDEEERSVRGSEKWRKQKTVGGVWRWDDWMILDHTKHTKGKGEVRGNTEGKERIEPTHVRKYSIHSLWEQKKKHARQDNAGTVLSITIPTQGAEEKLHSPDNTPTWASASKAPPWLAIFLSYNGVKLNSAFYLLIWQIRFYLPPSKNGFSVPLTTFSISSRSHCDVSLTISDSWRRDSRSWYMLTIHSVNLHKNTDCLSNLNQSTLHIKYFMTEKQQQLEWLHSFSSGSLPKANLDQINNCAGTFWVL